MDDYRRHLAEQVVAEDKIVRLCLPYLKCGSRLTVPGYLSNLEPCSKSQCQHREAVSVCLLRITEGSANMSQDAL